MRGLPVGGIAVVPNDPRSVPEIPNAAGFYWGRLVRSPVDERCRRPRDRGSGRGCRLRRRLWCRLRQSRGRVRLQLSRVRRLRKAGAGGLGPGGGYHPRLRLHRSGVSLTGAVGLSKDWISGPNLGNGILSTQQRGGEIRYPSGSADPVFAQARRAPVSDNPPDATSSGVVPPPGTIRPRRAFRSSRSTQLQPNAARLCRAGTTAGAAAGTPRPLLDRGATTRSSTGDGPNGPIKLQRFGISDRPRDHLGHGDPPTGRPLHGLRDTFGY